MLPKIDLTAFKKALGGAGVDGTIKQIQETMEEKAKEIGGLDIATLDPSALEAKFAEAQEAVSGAMDGMLAKAAGLQEELTGLQSKMGEVLGGLTPPGDLDNLISSAGLPSIPSVSDMAGKLTASLEVPQLSGLDAAIDTLGKAKTAAGGALSGVAGSVEGTLGGLAAGAKDSISATLAGAIPDISGAIPKIPDAFGALPKLQVGDGFQVPGMGEIGLGIPGGLNPAKDIPNVMFKIEPLFASPQSGEKVVAVKKGQAGIEPVADEIDDVVGDPIVLIDPAEILGNPFLKNNGLLVGVGRSPINKVEAPVSTVVKKDESTGENIVWEWRESGEWVPSGFPDMPTFEAQYKLGRQAAQGKIREVVGGLKGVVSENTNLFQKAAGGLNKIEIKIPEPPEEKGSVPLKMIVDSILNVKVNAVQAPVAEFQEAPNVKEGAFDARGNALPPGQSPPPPPAAAEGVFKAGEDPSAVQRKLVLSGFGDHLKF